MEQLIDELVNQGVTEFFIGSGSRSTPLVFAAAKNPKVRLHRHIDERALGFFALGSALARCSPSAVITTSGTAVGNLLPAVMEAHHSSTPLLILSADRPLQLHETSANQTTDQDKIFQNFTRLQLQLHSSLSSQSIRSKAAFAAMKCRAPHPGPVQINCQFEEPLYPLPPQRESGRHIEIKTGRPALASPLELPSKGVILIGKLPRSSDLTSILKLAKKLGWPVIADALSNARLHSTSEQIRHYDWLLSRAPEPEVFLHFGERLISKRVLEWCARLKREYWHISPHGHWFDPSLFTTGRIFSEIEEACERIFAPQSPGWLEGWIELDQSVQDPLRAALEAGTESNFVSSLSSLPLDDSALFLGSSMPVREADWFWFPKKAKGFFSNRGVSGIDGNIATAAGIAAGLQCPVVALVGDLTALHDLNSLALVKESKHPIRLLISNNGGGGIFSHLPVSSDSLCEKWVAFEHPLQFESAAKMYDLPYFKTVSLTELPPFSCVIEFPNSREKNIEQHRKLKECQSSFCTAS